MEDEKTYFLHPGYIFVSKEPHLIHTVLGSCISVCLWDPVQKFGGVCHFIYSKAANERNCKFGDVAVPYLFHLMYEMGSNHSYLKAHIIGGGENPSFPSPIGSQNADLAEKMVKDHRVEILTRDVYGQFGRKLIFNSGSGEILVSKINNVRREDWYGNHGI